MANNQNLRHAPAAITPEQYADAKAKYLEGASPRDLALALGCKRAVLDTRFSREGLPEIRNGRLKSGREGRTKDKLGEVLENLANGLVKKPTNSALGMNLQADTVQKVAKTASIIYGWGESPMVAVIVAGDLVGEASLEAEPEPIDI